MDPQRRRIVVTMLEYPTNSDWAKCRARAMLTIGKPYDEDVVPSNEWKSKILNARHSPIRFLNFSFLIENIPGNTATHFVRHVHAQPYVSSLRNDRQDRIDGDNAPRNTPVNMIIDMNAEELMVMANKRLCNQASQMTRMVMGMICKAVIRECPEFETFLVPMCFYNGMECHEFNSCGLCHHN